MKGLTEEQQRIIHTNESIRINAVAGSGKTTTLVEYARTRPAGSRILYLAFNRSVKHEAQLKFAAAGLSHVHIETAHSLAYKSVVWGSAYRVKGGDYKSYELSRILGVSGKEQPYEEVVIAHHVLKFVSFFCNSDAEKVNNLSYIDTIDDPTTRAFVEFHYAEINLQTRQMLAKMNSSQMEVTHDFYLKKFQLSKPQLPYDYILFDEAQDASPVMLDVLRHQSAICVMVGDMHQQIYGWRYAVNAMEHISFPLYTLSVSFRFGGEIARLAKDILTWKQVLGVKSLPDIQGRGVQKEIRQKAVIARTNLGLLLRAIQYITSERKPGKIYFEGNLSNYTYAGDGASLYDVLHLYMGRRHQIRDPLLLQMRSMDDLKAYIEKTGDRDFSMMVSIVEEYEDEVFDLIRELKQHHVEDSAKHQAQVVFSTVHKSKGMEYDSVRLAPDFMSEDRLERSIQECRNQGISPQKLAEEVNLLYVAATRAKAALYLPETLLPNGKSYALPIVSETSKTQKVAKNELHENARSYLVNRVNADSKNSYQPWREKDDELLIRYYGDGTSIKDIADILGRSYGAIASRIKKLELEDYF